MPETPESHKDHCNLEVLNDATLLHNTRRRFNEDNIYTYISEILLVVNPFKEIPGAYDDETLAKYKGGAWTKLDPHIFAVAEMSFVHMCAAAAACRARPAPDMSSVVCEESNRVVRSCIPHAAPAHVYFRCRARATRRRPCRRS